MIPFHGLLLSCWVAAGAPNAGAAIPSTSADGRPLVETLLARDGRWRKVRGRFRHRSDATPHFVDKMAEERDATAEAVRDQFTIRQTIDFRWSLPDRFLLRDGRSEGGKETAVRIVASDGTDSFTYSERFGTLVPNAGTLRIVADAKPAAAGMCGWTDFLGLAGVGTPSLGQRLQEGEADLGVARDAGDGSLVVTKTQGGEGYAAETRWIFAGPQEPFPFRHEVRYREGDGAWTVRREATVATRNDPSPLGPAPEKVTVLDFGPEGEADFVAVTEFVSLAPLADAVAADFRPPLRTGNNVIDDRTGESTVYGGEPGAELLARLAEHTRHSQKVIAQTAEQFEERSADVDPGRPWIPWTLAAVGLGLIAAAAAIAFRRNSNHTAT